MSESSDGRASWLILAAAVLSAGWLMFPATRPLPLLLDEHLSFWLCSPDSEISISQRNLDYAAVPPLASWLQAGSLAVLGKSEFALRVPSQLCYVLSVLLLFGGTRKDFGMWPAALASLMLAWHPDVVDDCRIGRPYGAVLLAVTSLFVCTWQLIFATGRKQGVLWGVAWGVSAAAALWAHVLTIPVLGCTAIVLGLVCLWRPLPRLESLAAILIPAVAALPLLPFVTRIWLWRDALDYQSTETTFWKSCGPFVCGALPVGVFVWALTCVARPATTSDTLRFQRLKAGACLIIGVLPVLVLAIQAAQHPMLSDPRYRTPLAAAQSMLLALLLQPAKKTVACGGLVLAIAASWLFTGHSPTTLVRLDRAQAAEWKSTAEELQQTVITNGLEQAPVFVQSGIIEGTLAPIMCDDVNFHGYLSSRLGTFYAAVSNPRYGLPFFWNVNRDHVLTVYRSFIDTAPGPKRDLFIAAAVDTDVNRSSLAGFLDILREMGYDWTPIADHRPWVVLLHARHTNAKTPAETDRTTEIAP